MNIKFLVIPNLSEAVDPELRRKRIDRLKSQLVGKDWQSWAAGMQNKGSKGRYSPLGPLRVFLRADRDRADNTIQMHGNPEHPFHSLSHRDRGVVRRGLKSLYRGRYRASLGSLQKVKARYPGWVQDYIGR